MRKPAEALHEIEDAPDASEIEPADFVDDDLHAFSWTIESGTTAIKKTDRPVFLYRETVIPQKVRDFFSLGDLAAGRKRRIKLVYRDTPFDAVIEKTVHPAPRTRMLWKPDFAAVLRAEYPGWPEFFPKNRKEATKTPSIRFVKRQEPDQYDVEFEDASPAHHFPAHGSSTKNPAHASPAHNAPARDSPVHGSPIQGPAHDSQHYSPAHGSSVPGPAHASAPDSPDGTEPAFQVPLRPGDVIDNDTLTAIFRCSPHGEMRPSPRTNSLVLVSDHTTSVFEDTWVNNFFQYTGTGLTGKQALSSRHNRVLAESGTNGISLHLFEVFEEGAYVYDGEAELTDRPFLSRQPDREKNVRDVYIFPLRLRGRRRPPVPKKEMLKYDVPVTGEEPVRGRRISAPPHAEHRLPAQEPLTAERRPGVVSPAEEQDLPVPGYAKRRARGTCQLCEKPAPFRTRDGEPYLEIHHIDRLTDGGNDVIENTVALCPNCHRKMHALNLPADVRVLKSRALLKI